MTTLLYIKRVVIPAAYALLPDSCRSIRATAMLLAIALQESEAEHRRQLGPGPARGFWQFERAGIEGVLTHKTSKPLIMSVVTTLQYPGIAHPCHLAVEHNDVLAAVFARLLLWTLPVRLPEDGEPEAGWSQYLVSWRPGRPREHEWKANFATAWHVVKTDVETY